MPTISARDNENNRWKRNAKTKNKRKTNKQKRQKRTSMDRSYSARVKAKWFCCALKLGFLQLICKASDLLKKLENKNKINEETNNKLNQFISG